jgi:hypothetical protein
MFVYLQFWCCASGYFLDCSGGAAEAAYLVVEREAFEWRLWLWGLDRDDGGGKAGKGPCVMLMLDVMLMFILWLVFGLACDVCLLAIWCCAFGHFPVLIKGCCSWPNLVRTICLYPLINRRSISLVLQVLYILAGVSACIEFNTKNTHTQTHRPRQRRACYYVHTHTHTLTHTHSCYPTQGAGKDTHTRSTSGGGITNSHSNSLTE